MSHKAQVKRYISVNCTSYGTPAAAVIRPGVMVNLWKAGQHVKSRGSRGPCLRRVGGGVSSNKCEPGCTCRRHAVYYRGGRPGLHREPLKPDEVKVCTKCGHAKSITAFSLNRAATPTRNAVYRPECKACQAEAAKRWFADNPERRITSKRRNNWKSYGLTPEQYDVMLVEQGGVCAICGKEEVSTRPPFNTVFKLSVDHDHETGKVRGLLCQKCNRAIGLMNDSVDLLKRAIYYLQERA